ncbi:unnamed protein product, partial [Iphiclides podalirius]
MTWLVQARAEARKEWNLCFIRVAAVALLIAAFAECVRGEEDADLVIEIPPYGSGADTISGRYRLAYSPPYGSPAPNFTVPANGPNIYFQGLPGTKYHIRLYYSNTTSIDLLTWNQTITTAPEPPTDLNVTQGRNKKTIITWSAPAYGDNTGFRIEVIPLTDPHEEKRNITVEGGNGSYELRDVSPGITYQLNAFTLLHDKESTAYASHNFTVRPNSPNNIIFWFRNETTLLALWQPPFPSGFYTHYKVSIEPPDASDSVLSVKKEGEPPGPAQAVFKGLYPGRTYNVAVQTVSEAETSAPVTAQTRTVPLRPCNVSIDPHELRETSFRVYWEPPTDPSEFEKYQVSVALADNGDGDGNEGRRLSSTVRAREKPTTADFDGLEPGGHYTVTVKTISGKVTSWPAAADFTLKPLAVQQLQWREADVGNAVLVQWQPAVGSTQDEYKVSYQESGASKDDISTLTTPHTNVKLEGLLPGRNYTISVSAVARGEESEQSSVWASRRPLAPPHLKAKMKTAVTVLQEMMIKQGKIPEYDCISQSGPQHQAMFEYRCTACGVSVTAMARSKKEAKQEAARIMLLQLDERGYAVPPPFCRGGAPVHALGASQCSSSPQAAPPSVGPLSSRSYVALLNELCEEYRLPAVEYELTADTGPPHARHFTFHARLGMHQRHATSTTKKFARQLAAEQLYTYLKENLSRVTKDFVEDDALARAHEKAMERYVETREELGWRPHLGQKIADYHLDKAKRQLALEALEASREWAPERALEAVVGALGMSVERHRLASEEGEGLTVLALVPSAPALAMAAPSPPAAAAAALRYLRRALAA